jgi:hypothetical protein
MKRTRGRPAVVGHADGWGERRLARFDAQTDRREVTALRDMMPSRLPTDPEVYTAARDAILSVAYGCGGWTSANRLLDNPPDRENADETTLERLNRIKDSLIAQGWTYETLRAGLLQTAD